MNAQLIAVEDYNRHRTIIGYLGIVLIVGVVLLDVLFSMASSSIGPDFAFLKGSISAYYHSAGGVLFVAILAIIGVALLAYQGFDDDGRFTNYAGICALGIAVFPTYPSDGVVAQHFGLPSTTAFWPDIFDAPLSSVLHGCFAISFFFCSGISCVSALPSLGAPKITASTASYRQSCCFLWGYPSSFLSLNIFSSGREFLVLSINTTSSSGWKWLGSCVSQLPG